METERTSKRAGSNFRRRRRSGGNYSCIRICQADAGVDGFVAGILCYFMVAKVKARFGYDDSLDAFGVHGAGGTIGAILTGVFAVSSVNPILKDSRGNVLALGLIEGNAHQLLNQMAGVAIAWGLGIAGTIAILFFVDKLVGLRASPEHEIQGLDLSQHGEEAYNWEAS
jgi:ammonium transporter, Amt family